MPIDFAAIAERFGRRLALEARRALLAQQGIGKVLTKREKAAREVELATRGFPVVLFYNGAVTLRLAPSQRGLLDLVAPPPSFADQVAAGAMGFLGGIARAGAPLSEWSFERFVGSVDAALGEVEASIRRFQTPRPDMFDPQARTAGDLFGLLALGWNNLVEASQAGGDIAGFTSRVRDTMYVLGMRPADEWWMRRPRPAPATEDAGPARSLDERADVFTRYLAGGITVVIALPRLVGVLWEAASIALRLGVFRELERIERSVLDFRARLLRRSFTGVLGWGTKAANVAGAVHAVVGANAAFLLRLARELGTQFADAIRTFLIGPALASGPSLVRFISGFFDLARAIPGWLEAAFGFDLLQLVRDKTEYYGWALPSATLSDLLDSDGHRVNAFHAAVLRAVIDTAQDAADAGRALAWPFSQDWFDKKDEQLALARQLVDAMFPGWGSGGDPVVQPSAPPPFNLARPAVPNLYDTLMGGGRAERLVAIVDTFGRTLTTNLETMSRQAQAGLNDMATGFDRAAVEAARMRRDDRFTRAAGEAGVLSERVFGPEVQAQRGALARRPRDEVALAYERWLAGGGFVTVGSVIEGYVAEAAEHWRHQAAQGEEPTAPITATSPRILRQHATLGKVVLPRLTLWGEERELDAALADEVAAKFQAAVRDAFHSGQARLAALAAAP